MPYVIVEVENDFNEAMRHMFGQKVVMSDDRMCLEGRVVELRLNLEEEK